jgi:hypothetical protein
MTEEIKLFVVIEDKKEEQEKALSAIKETLEIDEDAENAGKIIPGSPMFSFSKAKILVHFASELDTATHRVKFIREARSAGGVDIVGIITDLMFPKNIGGEEEPNGFSVIAECITHDIPVVVCSDIDHHEVGYLKPIFPILGNAHPRGEIPIILDDKDWKKAISSLLKIRKE